MSRTMQRKSLRERFIDERQIVGGLIVAVAVLLIAQALGALGGAFDVAGRKLGAELKGWHVALLIALTGTATWFGYQTGRGGARARKAARPIPSEINKFGVHWRVRPLWLGGGIMNRFLVEESMCPMDGTALGYLYEDVEEKILPLPLPSYLHDLTFPPLVLACHEDGCGGRYSLNGYTMATAQKLVADKALGMYHRGESK